LSYLGRADSQLTLNGHRIEFDEINLRLAALLGPVEVFTVMAHPPGAVAHHQGVIQCLSGRLFKDAS